jgi:hypothetical protein
MIGRPYNVGLDDANLSKEELALKIKEHIPEFFVHFAEIQVELFHRVRWGKLIHALLAVKRKKP